MATKKSVLNNGKDDFFKECYKNEKTEYFKWNAEKRKKGVLIVEICAMAWE
jgi:hypothetical protein